MTAPSPATPLVKTVRWFDPRNRTVNGLGFILHRITALGLTLYLFLHLGMLSQLVIGEAAYDGFIKLVHNPIIMIGETLVVAAGFIHGFNGIRIALNSFGIGSRYQRVILVVILCLAVICTLLFAYKMFDL